MGRQRAEGGQDVGRIVRGKGGGLAPLAVRAPLNLICQLPHGVRVYPPVHVEPYAEGGENEQLE